MSVWAIMMVRDEEDVIEETLDHLVEQGVTGIYVLDNMSTDGTADILDDLVGELPLYVHIDPEPGYYQSRKMTTLANVVHEYHGAEWVWPVDADEIWSHESGRPIADVLADADGDVVYAELFNYYPTDDDPQIGSPFRRMVHRERDPQKMPKIIARWQPGMTIEMGNHGVNGYRLTSSGLTGLVVRHYPYRTEEQFIRKVRQGAAAYAATDLPYDYGAHWRAFAELTDAELCMAFERLQYDADLIRDPVRLA